MSEVDRVLESTSLERDEALLAIVRGLWDTVQHQSRMIDVLSQRIDVLSDHLNLLKIEIRDHGK